jgi:hypothetical protein
MERMLMRKKEKYMQKTLLSFALFLLLGSSTEVRSEGFDLGVGVGFVDKADSDSYEKGWDIELGYELPEINSMNYGAQLHFIKGWTSTDKVEEERAYGDYDSRVMAFDSQALYFTARPEDWWVQFKVGLAHANYHTVQQDTSGTGLAVGIGIMVGSENFRLHMFDIHRYQIGKESFYIYSFSIFLVPGAL